MRQHTSFLRSNYYYSAPVVGVFVLSTITRILSVAEASSFPGTIKPKNNADYWQSSSQNKSNNSTNPSSDDDEGESSSEWEWDDDAAMTVASNFISNNINNNNNNNEDEQVDDGTSQEQEKEQENAGLETKDQNKKEEPSGSPGNQFIKEKKRKRISDASNKREEERPPPAPAPPLPRKKSSTSSKPLQTLEKLQHMLDETDYMTTSSRGNKNEYDTEEVDEGVGAAGEDTAEGLWTSKDRSKYKKQQKHRKQQQYQMRVQDQRKVQQPQQQQQSLEPSVSSDADEQSDTDDGLGYTLPNFPVYMSDAEGDSEESEITAIQSETSQQQPERPFYPYPYPPPPTPPQQPQGEMYPNAMYPYHQQYPANRWYGPPPPYGHPGMPPPQHQHQQQNYGYSYYGWQPSHPSFFNPRGYVPRLEQPSTTISPRSTPRQQVPPQDTATPPLPSNPYPIVAAATATTPLNPTQVTAATESSHTKHPNATIRFRLDSIQKIVTCILLAVVVCYAGVPSSSHLSLVEYNQRFYNNLKIASLTTIPPLLGVLIVMDPTQNSLNSLISGFYHAFTFGYLLAFGFEILTATLIRLGVFCIWEQEVFALTPHVPLPIIPWVLREHRYRPKRITLLVQDFLSSCVVSTVIEEWIKLVLLQWSVSLPK